MVSHTGHGAWGIGVGHGDMGHEGMDMGHGVWNWVMRRTWVLNGAHGLHTTTTKMPSSSDLKPR